MRNKTKLTEVLVQQLDPGLGITVDRALNQWWFNLRPDGGLRLTMTGYTAFTELLNLEHYDMAIPNPVDLDSRLILAMDRRLQHPYYIKVKRKLPIVIVFFGSQEAVMANLYGNIKKFIDNYRVS